MKSTQGKLELNKPKKPKQVGKERLEPSEGISFEELVRRTGGERKWTK